MIIKNNSEYKRCILGIWDSNIPGISFDNSGVSNYASMYEDLCKLYPKGPVGYEKWSKIVSSIKDKGKNNKYDCVVGLSGGTDSSYLLHLLTKEFGLRPLAVNLDNGWSSDIAVKNILKMTKALNVDLYTHVIDYEEVKTVLRAHIKAGLPWVDGPTDNAIHAVLNRVAIKEGIKYIINGADFRTEGKQPSEWTYSDSKQMRYIVKKFENKNIKSFPYQTFLHLIYNNIINRIKVYRPLYYLDYDKSTAIEFLQKTYGWQYYGGHHHENIFTKFVISYWMPEKFLIDKRIITLSAQVMNGTLSRNEAIAIISKPPYDKTTISADKAYILKKLDLDLNEFETIWNSDNKYYWDYPSYMPLINKFFKPLAHLIKYILPYTPTILVEKRNRI